MRASLRPAANIDCMNESGSLSCSIECAPIGLGAATADGAPGRGARRRRTPLPPPEYGGVALHREPERPSRDHHRPVRRGSSSPKVGCAPWTGANLSRPRFSGWRSWLAGSPAKASRCSCCTAGQGSATSTSTSSATELGPGFRVAAFQQRGLAPSTLEGPFTIPTGDRRHCRGARRARIGSGR